MKDFFPKGFNNNSSSYCTCTIIATYHANEFISNVQQQDEPIQFVTTCSSDALNE